MEIEGAGATGPLDWRETVFQQLKEGGIRLVFYVPDARHSHLIRCSHQDPDIRLAPP